MTSSIVLPVIKSIQSHLQESNDDPSYIKNLKDDIYEDLNDRMKNDLNLTVLKKCTALDPRFKKLKVVSNKMEREHIWLTLEQELRDMLKAKESEVGNTDNLDNIELQDSEAKRRKIGLDFSESESETEDDVIATTFDPIKIEFESYRKEPEASRDLDPLQTNIR